MLYDKVPISSIGTIIPSHLTVHLGAIRLLPDVGSIRETILTGTVMTTPNNFFVGLGHIVFFEMW